MSIAGNTRNAKRRANFFEQRSDQDEQIFS